MIELIINILKFRVQFLTVMWVKSVTGNKKF
jgi:hypothetical protein